MNLLRVWITLPDGTTTELGEVAFGQPRPDGTAPSSPPRPSPSTPTRASPTPNYGACTRPAPRRAARARKPWSEPTARNAQHVMAMGHQFGTPSGGELADIGKQWLGDRTLAARIVGDVVPAVDGFRSTAEALGVAADSIEHFAVDIGERIGKLCIGL